MRTPIAFVALLLVACGPVPPELSDGGAGALDAQADAATDAGPRWVQVCGTALHRPRVGADAFCPAVHDYVAQRLASGPLPDAYVCADAGGDAGTDAAPTCGPAEHGWAVVETCRGWVQCYGGGLDGCYHCIAWSDDPWGL